jgi:curved DNA-binding protein CbpA
VTYYEELGLTPQASPEEIREAYRTLARLLHPDQYQEEKLKRAAEGQMRRLNRIYAELSDPERRRRYDQSLGGLADCGRRSWILPRGAHVAVAVALSAGVVAGWWARTLSRGNPPVPPATRPNVTVPAGAPAPRQAESARGTGARRRTASLPPAAARSGTENTAGAPVLQPLDPDLPAPVSTLAPAAFESAGTTPPPVEPQGQRPRFSGRWLYAHPPSAAGSWLLYPPEYIELVIVERNGRLRGSYRARYRVLDRAVSPYVAFQFEGEAPSSEVVQFPWTGPAGAHGAVRLHLVSENTLEVAWSVTEPSGQLALVSGTARLTRLREP